MLYRPKLLMGLLQYIVGGKGKRKIHYTCQIGYKHSIRFYYNIQTQYLKISTFKFSTSIAAPCNLGEEAHMQYV
ncbi:unnamed protein product, partial [marine sediment metagenome]